jgi:DNA-binding response OmpR family regulator
LAAAGQAMQTRKHIMHTLLIEPDMRDRDRITSALHYAGQRVTAVRTQEEALALVRESFYDLIVLTAPQEGRMDLPALLRAFHWRWPRSLVIVLSDASELQNVVAACGGAADALAVKPIEREELRRVIESAVRREKVRLRHPLTEPPRSRNPRETVTL